jgi:hypothetical protein
MIENKSKIPTAKPSRIRDADKVGIGTTLKKILEIKGADEILFKYSVPCMSCPMASFEIGKLEIGQVCKMYGLDCKKILKELNGL